MTRSNVLPSAMSAGTPNASPSRVDGAGPTAQTPTLLTLAVLAMVAIALITVGLPAVTAPAQAVEDVTAARVSGPDRVQTAVALAEQAFPEGTTQAVIATAVAAQDALTAASLAGAMDAALLLVYPDDLPAATSEALDRLGVENLVVVGGPLSVSEAVATGLADGRRTISRIAGQTQYDTAQLVSQATADLAGLPVIDGQRTILLANGEVFADALSGSPLAYAGPTPVLYTELGNLRAETASFIDAVDVEQVVILGGTAAVSEEVAQAIRALGASVVRLSGPNRVATSVAVAGWTADRLEFPVDAVMLARGDDFPDSLTAAQLAGTRQRPLVLAANPTTLSEEAVTYFRQRCSTIDVVQAVGGTAAVSAEVLGQAEVAAEACGAGESVVPRDDALPTYTVQPIPLLETTLSQLDTVEVTNTGGLTTADVAMFPCQSVAVDSDGSAVLIDGNADGFADRRGQTDSGVAIITGINNVNVEDAPVVTNASVEDGRLGIQVSSGADDCAAIIITEPGVTQIPVDDAGHPTVGYGATVVRFASSPGSQAPSTRVYAVQPDVLQDRAVGETATVTVTGRFDGEQIGRTLDAVLFPCDQTDVAGPGPDRFADRTVDGRADGFAATETGAAFITAINGTAVEPDTIVGGIAPVSEMITIELSAGAADCATVVIVAGNGNGAFDLNADGVPIEPYGAGEVRYS